MCDACGKEVPPGEGHREELAVGSSMCPAPMAFHDECWELASAMWEPEPESYCEVDPLYPETGRWLNLPEPPPDPAAPVN